MSCAAMLFAQGDRGVVTGTVKDASGAVVPNAQVTATHLATKTNFKTNTTASGDFTVPSMPVGNYQVRVEISGFKSYVGNDVVVTPGSSVRLDVMLEVGSAQQTVEVTANAALVEVESARVATSMSNKMVEDLPVVVNGGVRNPFDLAGTTAEATGSGDGSFRIGGGRPGSFGMTLDGTAITVATSTSQATWTVFNTPSVEALTEFSVEAGGTKADTGHASGGTVSFVSKSGTNEIHGNFYEYVRNQDFDARNFFAATRSVYKQNDFGATVGGPVWIPKIYNGKNKTFFFFSYEGFRNRVGATGSKYDIPPQEFFSGDLHNYVDANGKMYQIYDPSTTRMVGSSYVRDPFPGNIIPKTRIDPVSQSILNFAQPLLKANLPGTPGTRAYINQNYVSYGTTRAPNNKWSFKIDQVLTSKQRINFYFGRTREVDTFGPDGPLGLPKPLSGNPGYNRSDVYRISYDYTLTPTLLNRFYAGGNNWEQNHGAFSTYKDAPLSMGLPTTDKGWKDQGICIPNFPDCNANFPQVSFSEFTSWGVPAPNGSDNIVVELRDDMTKTTGPHTMKWGYYYNDTHYNGFGEQNIAGAVTFNRLNTGVPLNTDQNVGGGSSFASFLLGQVSGYSLDTPRYIASMYRTHQIFFQDDWRVSKRLTLNLGLRYELNMAPTVGEDKLSDLDPNLPNPAAGGIKGALIFAGTGTGRTGKRSLLSNWYGGIGPRVSFSFAVDSKTVIRGSATRSYGPVIHMGSASHNLGFVQRLTINDTSQGLSPLWNLKDGALPWAQLPMIDPSVGNGSNVPYYNGDGATHGSGEVTYAFNVQRQLSGSSVVEVGYLATLASGIQSALLYLNQLNLSTLPAAASPFTAAGRTLLNSQVGSAAANAAGIVAPWSGFNTLWKSGATVAQALRPFPQYGALDTTNGGGDRIGHSTYHSMQVKYTKRYSSGFTVNASYTLSKLLTDADGNTGTVDNWNRTLEKSIANYDQTHVVKLTYVYELPFGKGRRWLTNRSVGSALLGGWRFSGIHGYNSGSPMGLSTSVGFPIFNGGNRPMVPTYDGWRAPTAGSSFDPAVDKYLQPASFFGTQPTDQFGNMTRYNPKMRNAPGINENVSLARTINMGERFRWDLRGEAFNLLNRVAFGSISGGTSLQNANFGLWRSQSNSPRRMQFALKLSW
jgi:hypothetical protein